MLLRCHTPFGNFVPGDEIEVPEGSGFDPYHFELVTAEEPEPATETPVESE